jgi:hypothetical protein
VPYNTTSSAITAGSYEAIDHQIHAGDLKDLFYYPKVPKQPNENLDSHPTYEGTVSSLLPPTEGTIAEIKPKQHARIVD